MDSKGGFDIKIHHRVNGSKGNGEMREVGGCSLRILPAATIYHHTPSISLLSAIVWSLTPAIDIYERCTESNSCIWTNYPLLVAWRHRICCSGYNFV